MPEFTKTNTDLLRGRSRGDWGSRGWSRRLRRKHNGVPNGGGLPSGVTQEPLAPGAVPAAVSRALDIGSSSLAHLKVPKSAVTAWNSGLVSHSGSAF